MCVITFWLRKSLRGKNKYGAQGSANSSKLEKLNKIKEQKREEFFKVARSGRITENTYVVNTLPKCFSCTLVIGNNKIYREIWKNHALVRFSKNTNSTRRSDSCYFEVFDKLTSACFLQIALEILQALTYTNCSNFKFEI